MKIAIMKLSVAVTLLIQSFVVFGLAPNSDENDVQHHVHPEHGASWVGHKSNIQHPRFRNMRFGALKRSPEEKAKQPFIHHSLENEILPISFDAREKWGNKFHVFGHCKHIGTIRDQSKCGSCWAFGAVEAMGDRLCIHSNFKFNELLSAKHLLSCCRECGFGCEGGYPDSAWRYWVTNGIAKENCQPYPFPSCNHHGEGTKPPCPEEGFRTPKCNKTCDNPKYDIKKELTFGNTSYLVPKDPDQIMYELMTRGPMEVAFNVYEDFMTYEKGIYFHAWGEELGGHAIRLVGWGEEDGVPYWTLANSWNSDWGENGFFRILRGADECGIESEVTAGMPKLT